MSGILIQAECLIKIATFNLINAEPPRRNAKTLLLLFGDRLRNDLSVLKNAKWMLKNGCSVLKIARSILKNASFPLKNGCLPSGNASAALKNAIVDAETGRSILKNERVKPSKPFSVRFKRFSKKTV